MITGAQLRAARALLRWSADDLATASQLGVATIRRAEAVDGPPPITEANCAAAQRALEAAGVEFTNGGQPGVRMTNTAEHWQRVVFDDEKKASGMVAILAVLNDTIIEKGRPQNGKIWHKPTGSGDNLYFFSPTIAALIPEALKDAKAVQVPAPADLKGLKEISF